MATLTRDQIIAEALSTVGRDELSTLAVGWLQRWLDSVGTSFDWPLLRKEFLGFPLTGVPANSTGYQFGNGNGTTTGPAARVLEIYDNIWAYTAADGIKSRVFLESFMRRPEDKLTVEGVGTGLPQRILAEKDAALVGQFTLYPWPEPNQTYLLSIPYRYIPAVMSTGSTVPWFPDDQAMISAVEMYAWKHVDGNTSDTYKTAQQDVATLLSNARLRNASETPNLNRLELSQAFRRKGTGTP